MPELRISPEKVCFIVMRARQFEAKEGPSGLGEGSNPSDQGIEDEAAYLDTLEDGPDDATEEELRDAIASLNDDEKLDLIALMWLGRDDDATLDDWDELLSQVADSQDTPAEDYLMGTPLLPEYLDEGLAKFGISCTDLMPSGERPEEVTPVKSTR